MGRLSMSSPYGRVTRDRSLSRYSLNIRAIHFRHMQQPAGSKVSAEWLGSAETSA